MHITVSIQNVDFRFVVDSYTAMGRVLNTLDLYCRAADKFDRKHGNQTGTFDSTQPQIGRELFHAADEIKIGERYIKDRTGENVLYALKWDFEKRMYYAEPF